MAIEPTGTSGLLTATINRIQEAQSRTLSKIASGKQIERASDDAAGLAVLMSMKAQTRGLTREISNRQDEVSLMQTAEGAMGTSQDAIQRIRELSVQAANGTLSNEDRAMIQQEVNQLNQFLDTTANSAQFNTKNLLDGSLSIKLQNGQDLTIASMTSESLGLTDIDVTTQEGASAALGLADRALSTVSSERSRLGAFENGNVSEMESLQQQLIDTLNAKSRIGDADIARQMIDLTTQQIQAQTSISAFRMDNERRQAVLSLLE